MESAGIKILAAIVGFWLIMRSVRKSSTTHKTLIDTILGQSASAQTALPTTNAQTGNAGSGPNPFSANATGSRLDQGFDLTSKIFGAPAPSRIVYSKQIDPGWAGGGYVAGQVLSGPQAGKVWYMAEGIAPDVQVGQTVMQGERVGIPVSNPYNGIVGNIETGFANPASPGQPLAQVVANPRQSVLDFYNWIRSLGAPAATSTSSAGHA
jgi:biotin carboxyl carrier protein